MPASSTRCRQPGEKPLLESTLKKSAATYYLSRLGTGLAMLAHGYFYGRGLAGAPDRQG
jgi:hypothetical protein